MDSTSIVSHTKKRSNLHTTLIGFIKGCIHKSKNIQIEINNFMTFQVINVIQGQLEHTEWDFSFAISLFFIHAFNTRLVVSGKCLFLVPQNANSNKG